MNELQMIKIVEQFSRKIEPVEGKLRSRACQTTRQYMSSRLAILDARLS